MGQYCSHTPDILSYMARYLTTFHQKKDVFLVFCTSKATQREANQENQELRELIANQHAKEVRHNTAAKCGEQPDQDRLQRFNHQAS